MNLRGQISIIVLHPFTLQTSHLVAPQIPHGGGPDPAALEEGVVDRVRLSLDSQSFGGGGLKSGEAAGDREGDRSAVELDAKIPMPGRRMVILNQVKVSLLQLSMI